LAGARQDGAFPKVFCAAIAGAGWLGIAMPGSGTGLGITQGAIMTQAVAESGGATGFAREYHAERHVRESLIPRTAPISRHMILNFLEEKALDLPRLY
jgi:hypothetical protein